VPVCALSSCSWKMLGKRLVYLSSFSRHTLVYLSSFSWKVLGKHTLVLKVFHCACPLTFVQVSGSEGRRNSTLLTFESCADEWVWRQEGISLCLPSDFRAGEWVWRQEIFHCAVFRILRRWVGHMAENYSTVPALWFWRKWATNHRRAKPFIRMSVRKSLLFYACSGISLHPPAQIFRQTLKHMCMQYVHGSTAPPSKIK
jgi:hypothetical protein